MFSKSILIGVAVGVFFAGIVIGYVIFLNSFQPDVMMTQTQIMQRLMMQSPEHRQQMMNQMFADPDLRQQMMDSMVQNPQQMRTWMADTRHVEEMSGVMRENHDFMMDMMQAVMDDPSLRLQMIGHMTENPEVMQQMMELMGSGGMMMGNMMNSGMSGSSMMTNMPFNTNAPITMPMIDGYYSGKKVFFVHTEVSDKNMADMMSMMINFPTLHVSKLSDVSSDEMAKVYVFTNGISGSGPYGGGPFMYQIDVFDSIPDQMGYNQFRVPHLVTWNDDSTPRILTSEDEILEAATNGELTIKKTDNVVNAPMIVWESNGTEQRASIVQRMFESMPGVDGEVTNIDVDNYLVMMRLYSQNGMSMMDQGMMNP